MGLFTRNPSKSTAAVADEIAGARRTITLVKGTGPAVDRETVAKQGGVDFVKKFDRAGLSLSKVGLDGIRAEAVLILDHSGSMSGGYRSGMVQTLVDRALAFALQIDVDGTIPVIPFDSRLWPPVSVTLDNYTDVVNREIFRPREMGGTYLAPALEAVLDLAKVATSPIFLVIVTDDDPTDAQRVTALLRELAKYAVFVKVLTLVPAPFWDSIDNIRERGRVDNLNARRVIDPAGMSDLAFADVMVDEWAPWVGAATRTGILR